jgi:glycosyltransferase involved in cell wall biosynthesis
MNTVDKMRFSIIIPSFNASQSIEACLDSIYRQHFTSFEVWIIDGGSTDDTLSIVEKFGTRYTSLHLISEKDRGIYDAMNKGIDKAGGEWLLFLGADDELYDPLVLQNAAAASDATAADVIYGNVKIVGNTSWATDGTIYDGVFETQKLLNKNICHQAIFYRTEFIRTQIGYYNIGYRLCADWDFNLRCWAKKPFLYLDTIVAKFHGGGETTRVLEDKKFTDEYIGNVLTYFNLSPFDKMINNKAFCRYYDLRAVQKERNYIRYLFNRVQKKLLQ